VKVGILPLEPAAAGLCQALNLHPEFYAAEGWGKNVIPRLSKDLSSEFPEMKVSLHGISAI
jgi:hypothetical protein